MSAAGAHAPAIFPAGKLLIATQNPGKLREITALLADLPLTVVGPSALDRALPHVSEDGLTYEANARAKAESACRATGLAVLADDSGLEVYGLAGAPGVYSARFAGSEATDAENNAELLARLAAAPAAVRQARFVCTAVLWSPSGLVRVTTGEVRGRIADAGRGGHGFGYDPLFFYPPLQRTFGEVSDADKEAVSHRGAAFRAMASEIRSLLAAGVGAGPA